MKKSHQRTSELEGPRLLSLHNNPKIPIKIRKHRRTSTPSKHPTEHDRTPHRSVRAPSFRHDNRQSALCWLPVRRCSWKSGICKRLSAAADRESRMNGAQRRRRTIIGRHKPRWNKRRSLNGQPASPINDVTGRAGELGRGLRLMAHQRE